MTDDIETKLKAIEGRNFCRGCHHFIRVNFDSVRNVMHRQGFCILGRLQCDYSLYFSCGASECMGFLFDQKHYDIAMAEQALSDGERDFSHSCNDKRSTNYKKVAPLIEETRKYIDSVKKENVGLGTVMAMREVEVTANKYFREANSDKYMECYRMVTIKKSDYLKFVAKLSVQLHDKFCDCDKLEFNDGVKL